MAKSMRTVLSTYFYVLSVSARFSWFGPLVSINDSLHTTAYNDVLPTMATIWGNPNQHGPLHRASSCMDHIGNFTCIFYHVYFNADSSVLDFKRSNLPVISLWWNCLWRFKTCSWRKLCSSQRHHEKETFYLHCSVLHTCQISIREQSDLVTYISWFLSS